MGLERNNFRPLSLALAGGAKTADSMTIFTSGYTIQHARNTSQAA